MPLLSSSSFQAIDEFNLNRSRLDQLIDKIQSQLIGIIHEEQFPLVFSFKNDPPEDHKRSPSRSRSASERRHRQQAFNILNLATNSASSVSRIDEETLQSLDSSSTKRLLMLKVSEASEYLTKAKARISSNISKVLIVGDVNSGKSAFVNALLKTELLPSDQQPCTQAFTEVVIGGATSQVHAISSISDYRPGDARTFAKVSLPEFTSLIQEDPCAYPWFRVLVGDDIVVGEESRQYLHDTAIIDSPGLNCDSFKTMALFAQQEDIDIVVFLLNAANHLTLSARDFLEAAGVDKSDNIFVVINRFDDIKNKDKCMKQICQQINDLFPGKYTMNDLFFVSAKQELHGASSDSDSYAQEFERLKSRLIDYLFKRKSRTKLFPAHKYAIALLDDLLWLVDLNVQQSQEEIGKVDRDISEIVPTFEALQSQESSLAKDLELRTSESRERIYTISKQTFDEVCQQVSKMIEAEPWLGVFGVSTFQRRVRVQIANHILQAVGVNAQKNTDELARSIQGMLSMCRQRTGLDIKYASEWNVVGSRRPIIFGDDWNWYQLIDVRKELFSYKTWLGASSFFAALFGYQPLTHLLVKLGGRLLTSVSVVGACMLAGGSALALTFFVDFEGMFKRGLGSKYERCLGEQWCHEQARTVEAECHSVLSGAQATILNQFFDAISAQRRLKLQKDITRAHQQARFSHFSTLQQRLQGLRAEATSLKF